MKEKVHGKFFQSRAVKTAVLVYSWICLGWYGEYLGPSLPSLKLQVNCTTEGIARAMASRSFGLFVGSVMGGVLHDRFDEHRTFIIGFAILIASILFITIVFCKFLWLLGVVLFLIGCCHGIHTTGGNPYMVDVWKRKAAGPLNLLHAGYGVGGAVAPLVIKSFIIDRNGTIPGSYISQVPKELNGTKSAQDPLLNLAPSYVIMSSLCLISSLSFFVIWFGNKGVNAAALADGNLSNSKKSKLREFISTFKSTRRNVLLSVGLLVAIFFFYFLIIGGDRVHSRFLLLYATESDLRLNMDEGFLLNSLYWIMFTISRLVAAVALVWVSVEAVLGVEVIGSFVSAIFMVIFPFERTVFWISSSTFSFFKSPTYPTGLGVLNRYIEITGILNLIINCGCAVGAILMQWLSGFGFDSIGPITMVYSNLGHTIGLAIVGLIVVVLGRMKGLRFSSTTEGNGTVSSSNGGNEMTTDVIVVSENRNFIEEKSDTTLKMRNDSLL